MIAFLLSAVMVLQAPQLTPDNIRDVVAFPTTNSSLDLMSESPNVVDQAQLDILGISIK